MSDMPLVSVCVPAYNHEQYIEQCIQSIIDQTYSNIELIVIDDGSKDSTWKKLCDLREKCEKRFKNVVFMHQENQGTCITCNRSAALAKGKYFSLIASDDASKPSAIEECVNFLEKNPEYVLCLGDNEIIDSEGKRVAWDEKRKILPLGEGYQTFASFLMSKKGTPKFDSPDFGTYATLVQGNYIVNGFLIRKDTFDSVGGYSPEAPLEDWYLMLQLSKCGKFKFIDKILFSYRWHDDNNIKKKERMKQLYRKTVLYEEKLLKEKYPDLLPIFYEKTTKKKYLIKLKPFFEICKIKDLYFKRIRLSLFGLSITIYKKSI